MPKIFDDPDTWFNGTTRRTKKSKGAAGGSTGGSFRPINHKARASNVIKGVQSANPKGTYIPQAVVKISGSSKGMDKAQAHANYIGRKGEVEIEDEEGNSYEGEEQKQLLKSWEAMGIHPEDKTGTRKEALHLVFSMPKGTNPDGLKSAVRNLVQEEFAGHKYFMAQHLDTDSPHCHVLLCMTDDRGARLNPRKADLHNYRVAFVNKLAEQGINATASRRIHRFKYVDSKKQYSIHKDQRLNKVAVSKKPTITQQKNIERAHAVVLSSYKEFEKTLPPGELKAAVKTMIKNKEQKKDLSR